MVLRIPRTLRGNRGFSLIELMVVVIILGILAMYIGPKLMGRTEQAKVVQTRVQIEGLETALKLYKLDNGAYPTTEQGLQALVEMTGNTNCFAELAQRRLPRKRQSPERSVGQ